VPLGHAISTFAYDSVRGWLRQEVTAIIFTREILAVNEKDSIGSAPAEEWRGATDGGAGALRIEFIERSRNQWLGIEWFLAADRAEWST